MANRDERKLFREGRYEPSAGFDERLMGTLQALPARKRGSGRDKLLQATAIAAALLIFLALGMPKVVEAASALYERLFGQMVSEMKREQAVPSDEKLQRALADSEAYSRAQDYALRTALRGEALTLQRLELWAEDRGASSGGPGTLQLRLAFDQIPAFDPNYVDFVLSIDGRDVPMEVSQRLATYRQYGGQCLTEQDWRGFGTYGIDVAVYDGLNLEVSSIASGTPDEPQIFLPFQVENWRWDEPHALVLKADGMQIPFDYDPVAAHELALREAQEAVRNDDEYLSKRLAEAEQMQANAVALGITGSAFGHDYVISEMSYDEAQIHFTYSIGQMKGVPKEDRVFGYHLNAEYIEGMACRNRGWDSEHELEDASTAVSHSRLIRDPARLPDESLILLELEMGDTGKWLPYGDGLQLDINRAYTAFRYNWNTRAVTLPKDDAERAAWVAEAQSERMDWDPVADPIEARDLRGLGLTQTIDGVTVTLTEAWASEHFLDISYEIEDAEPVPNAACVLDFDAARLTVNGIETFSGGGGFDGKTISSKQFTMHELTGLLGADSQLVFTLRVARYDAPYEEGVEPAWARTFEFVFTLKGVWGR